MFRKPAVLHVLIAVIALSIGSLVYLLDRQPDRVYFLSFLPHGLTFVHGRYPLFGIIGDSFPTFVHVYAFILLTVGIAGSSNPRLLRICTLWFVIAALFECGQHPLLTSRIAAALPAWFARVPILDNTAAFFLKGTFDLLDLLSIALGTIAAYLTAVLIRHWVGAGAPDKPRRSVWRYLALSGLTLFGMLAIIGSGGGSGTGGTTPVPASGGPTALFIDPIHDQLYVANTGGNSVQIYDNASLLNGGTTPDRTLTGKLTTLSAPTGIYVDTTRNLLFVSNGNNQILVFSNAATVVGDVAPARSLAGLSSPDGIFVDIFNDRLYVANRGANSVLVFNKASSVNGSPAPDRVLSGGSSALNQPRDLFVDTGTDRLYVANAGDSSILVFNNASSVNNPATPDRTLSLPSGTGPWGIYVDATPVVIGSTASLDGYARSDGTASATGSPATGDKDAIYFGVGWRQLYSFDISSLPTNSTIASAILRLYQCDVEGFPYTYMGNVIVDHVDYGGVFDPFGSAYNGATVAPGIGTLSATTSLGYRSLDITTSAQDDLTALPPRTRSQYRLRFSIEDSNLDGNNDFVQFTDAEDSPCAGQASTNQPPELALTLANSSQLYVSGNGGSTLLSYDNANTVSGSTAVNRVVTGGSTTLNAPRGIAVDMARNQIYVANFANNTILVFDNARTASGGIAPSRTIKP